MFGFLKQKLADFGNKLKQTISKEEEKKEPLVLEEAKKPVQKKEPDKKEIHPIQKKETLPKTKEEAKKPEEKKTVFKADKKEPETEKKEIKSNQAKQKEIETEKNKLKELAKESLTEAKIKEEKADKPKGILSKIFGLGKKKDEKQDTQAVQPNQTDSAKDKKPDLEEPQKAKPAIKVEKIKKEKTKAEEIKELILKKETEKEQPKEEITPEEIEEEVEETEEELIKEKEEKREEKPRDIHVATIEEDKRHLKANIGVGGGLKGLIFGGIEITEKQIEDLLWELELSLIEGDVDQDAASELTRQIKQRLVGKKVSAKNIDEYLHEQIKEILAEMMKTEKINVLENANAAKKNGEVYKILLLGPNGAGKTTTIAKLVNYFQKNNLSCIVAAGDTFRAGAIDQIEEHAKKLGVRVIKHQYGADPAAIAFDAISAAKAGKIDVVLIDSAGRQETNKNLMEELKKLERVAKPNLKIFIGESYVGQGLLDQVDEFEKIIGIDGYILTKLDTDAKGGTAISLTYKTKKPIIFIGTGQGYDDFEEFTPKYILDRIV